MVAFRTPTLVVALASVAVLIGLFCSPTTDDAPVDSRKRSSVSLLQVAKQEVKVSSQDFVEVDRHDVQSAASASNLKLTSTKTVKRLWRLSKAAVAKKGMKASKAMKAMEALKAAFRKAFKAAKATKASKATKATKAATPTEGQMVKMRAACKDWIEDDTDLMYILQDHGNDVQATIDFCSGGWMGDDADFGHGGDNGGYGAPGGSGAPAAAPAGAPGPAGGDDAVGAPGDAPAAAAGEAFPAVGSAAYNRLAAACTFADGPEDLKMVFQDEGSSLERTIAWCKSMFQ